MACGFHWLPCWWSAVVLESFPAKRGKVAVLLPAHPEANIDISIIIVKRFKFFMQHLLGK
jgi:hypothetical protein